MHSRLTLVVLQLSFPAQDDSGLNDNHPMDGGPTSSSEPDAKPLSVLTSQIQRQQQATGHDGPGVDRRGPSWQADDRFDAVKNPISPSATSTSIPIPRKTSASAAAANPRRIRRQTTEGALGDGFPGNFSSSPPDDFLIFSSSQPRQAGMSRSVHTSGRSRTVTAPLPIPMSYHAPSAATTSAHNFHADLLPAPSFTDGTFFTAGRSPGRGLGKSPGTSPMKSSVSPGRSLGKPSAGRSPEPALRTHPLPRKGDKEWEEEEKEKENLKKMEEKRTLGKKKESRESLLADLKTDFKKPIL
ncbi:hypothetical protein HK101_011375 [Irineochytrium annulatum]|nr:hypothetical protein HK101_011375 [Irineochytrium annulatum]